VETSKDEFSRSAGYHLLEHLAEIFLNLKAIRTACVTVYDP
jgi:hypothetical protein